MTKKSKKPELATTLVDDDVLTFDDVLDAVVDGDENPREDETVDVADADDGEALSFDEDEKEDDASALEELVGPVGDDVFVASSASKAGTLDISSLITDVDDSVEHLTWLIYGKNGTGKTTLLSTVDGMLILAAEDGTLSIREKAKGTAKKIRVDTWDKIEQVYWLLKNGKYTGEGIEIPVAGGTFLVKSVGFDTLTKLVDVCLRGVVLGDKAKDPTIDILKPTLAHQNQVAQRMKYWLEMYKQLPIQKVWLAQEDSNSEDLQNEEFSIYPAMSKSIRLYALSQADVIARTYIKQLDDKRVQYRLSIIPNQTYVTKDRTNKLGAIFPNPKLSALYERAFAE